MVNIYKLIHPITNEVRYVGKTTEDLKKRLGKHIYNKKNSAKVNKWVRKLISLNLKPIIELIEICEDNIWEEREIYWINYYKQLNSNLLNITIGGDTGCLGYKHTEEAKKRISILNKRPKSEEWKEKAATEMRKAVAIPILQFDRNNNLIKEWESFCYAAKEINPENYKATIKNIHACCNNKRKSAYNYFWTYKNN